MLSSKLGHVDPVEQNNVQAMVVIPILEDNMIAS